MLSRTWRVRVALKVTVQQFQGVRRERRAPFPFFARRQAVGATRWRGSAAATTAAAQQLDRRGRGCRSGGRVVPLMMAMATGNVFVVVVIVVVVIPEQFYTG